MSNFDFTEIAGRYERDSLVQKGAAEVLISMLEIGPREDVLDLGCGTGHLTKRLFHRILVKFQQRYQMRHRKSRDEDARWGFNSAISSF